MAVAHSTQQYHVVHIALATWKERDHRPQTHTLRAENGENVHHGMRQLDGALAKREPIMHLMQKYGDR